MKAKGPLGKKIWIRGTYKGGAGFSKTPASHAFQYKGEGLYQVVVKEKQASAFSFKFATKNWSSEFAVKNSKAVIIGKEQAMSKASGMGTESPITIPEAGTYVYSFKLNDDMLTGSMMVSKCE